MARLAAVETVPFFFDNVYLPQWGLVTPVMALQQGDSENIIVIIKWQLQIVVIDDNWH